MGRFRSLSTLSEEIALDGVNALNFTMIKAVLFGGVKS